MSLYPLTQAVTRLRICDKLVQLGKPITPVAIFKVLRNRPGISFIKETIWVEARFRISYNILQKAGRLLINWGKKYALQGV
jgi:hypothetical protein